ncbi:MAG TPA: hypothetical protein VKZ64_06075 [Arenimonas sp.]|jgi:Na+-transporting NADH:ubiquinone oxidoreductase subunit NqrB|nr:hypothetical protein [Arenimonas sp.]
MKALKHIRKPLALLAGMALVVALAPAAMAQDEIAVAAPGGAVAAKAQLAFRVVIRDVVHVEDGRWEDAGEGRAAHLPRFQLRQDEVDGRPVLTVAQP